MLTLVGVGHVFDISLAIEKIIEDRKPDVVALELDRLRLMALESEDRGKARGLYGMLAKYQEKLAEAYGTVPGAEMLAASRKARECGSAVALIDMDARRVWTKLRKSMRFREKMYIFFGFFAGVFVRGKRMDAEIEKLQKEPESFMDELGKKLPTAKRVLIEERNTHMARNIERLMERYGVVVAFVGDGHISGLSTLIKADKEIIRLRQIVEGEIPAPGLSGDVVVKGNSASFSFMGN